MKDWFATRLTSSRIIAKAHFAGAAFTASRALPSVLTALALAVAVPMASGRGGARSSAIAAQAAPSPPARSAGTNASDKRTPIIETSSLWRCFVVRGSELVRKESGELGHLYEFGPVKTKKVGGKRVTCLNEVQVPVHTPWPPAEWPSVDFDDSRWACAPGPFYVFTRDAYGLAGDYLSVVLVCLRRRFAVEDPSRIRDLRLSLEFEGGVVVYLNGKELARAHLPAGELKPDTPAEDYPKDAFVAPSGYLLRRRYGDPKKYPRRFEMRTRRIRDLAIPARMLRKGLNVLAIEIHRAPGHEAMFTGKTRRVHPRPGAWWNRIGLRSVSLTAAGVSGGIAGKARPTGLLVWNQPVITRVEPAWPVDPDEPLRPVRIVGVRNGAFSGQIVVSDTRPIEGLRVAVGGLTFDPLLGSGDNPLEGKAFSTSADLGILLLHYSVEGHIYPAVGEPILCLEAIDALKGVNLFAVGHVHKHAHFRLGDKYVVIPGATERLTFGQDETSGFVYIEATKGGIEKLEYIPLESQPREELVVRTPELDPEEPTASILRRLEPISHPDKMVKLRLEGPLLRDVYHRLDFGRLREWGMSHNFFFDVDCTVLKLEDEHHRSGARGARISLLEELLFTADRCIAEAGDEEERELLVESKLAIQRFFEQGW